MNSETKKEILIVTSEFPPQPGGIGNHAYHLALYLSKYNYSISVLADQRSYDNAQEITFDANLPFVVKRIKLRRIRFLMYFQRIVNTFNGLKNADMVIATGKFSLWNVAFCKLFLKTQSLAVIHGSEVNFKSTFPRKAIDLSLKSMNQIVAVSNYTKSLVAHLKKQVIVIPNGIDFSHWKKNSVKKHQVIQGDPILTTVGRVSKRKGQLQVINHLPSLLKIYPDLHYHCLGIPTEADDFIQVAKSLNVEHHVTFHGAVTDEFLKHIFDNTDIFLMLSTESKTGDVEGFGIAILEANAYGIPAIGSKGCGIEDAVKQGYSGFLIDVDNANDFRDGIESILKDKDFFKSNAVLWAQQHDWNVIIKQYNDLLKCQH